MDDDLPKKRQGTASMSPERRREVSAAGGKAIRKISEEGKALERKQGISLAAAFQSWVGPRRPSQ